MNNVTLTDHSPLAVIRLTLAGDLRDRSVHHTPYTLRSTSVVLPLNFTSLRA